MAADGTLGTLSTEDRGLRIARLLAGAGWLDVGDRILSGICHDLNGRVSSLDGLIQLLTLDGDEGTPVVPYLEAEVAKLESVVRLLRLIPGDLAAAPEPMPAEDLARRVAELQSKHRGHEMLRIQVTAEQGLPPVLVNWARVGRALAVIAARVAQAALDAGERTVPVSLAGNEDEVRLTLGTETEHPARQPAPAPGGEGGAEALAEVLEEDGLTLAYPGPRIAVVRLPSLARARAEGR